MGRELQQPGRRARLLCGQLASSFNQSILQHVHSPSCSRGVYIPNEQDDTQTPDVDLRGIRTHAFGLQHFRGNIQRSAAEGLHDTLRVHKLGKAEVRHFYQRFPPLARQQNIFGLGGKKYRHFCIRSHYRDMAKISVTKFYASECCVLFFSFFFFLSALLPA